MLTVTRCNCKQKNKTSFSFTLSISAFLCHYFQYTHHKKFQIMFPGQQYELHVQMTHFVILESVIPFKAWYWTHSYITVSVFVATLTTATSLMSVRAYNTIWTVSLWVHFHEMFFSQTKWLFSKNRPTLFYCSFGMTLEQ